MNINVRNNAKHLIPAIAIATWRYVRFVKKSDYSFLRKSYENRFNKKIDITNPLTLNEKIIARKFVREPKSVAILVDKISVKNK